MLLKRFNLSKNNKKVHAVIGVLDDDADPMVTVMKLEKAPQETYADIGGLDQQIQEIKVRTKTCLFRLLYQLKVYCFI
jgi:ATP-dependent 26S proteasome regulatory subunit